jgi:hypothetical protein
MPPAFDSSDDAIKILRLFAEPERLRVAAAVVLGHDRVADIAAVSGVDERAVARALARLAAGGLVVQERGAYRFAAEELKIAARRIAVAEAAEDDLNGEPNGTNVLRAFLKRGQLTSIPAVHSKRLVVLDYLAQTFEPGRRYAEAEVNKELSKFHDDVAALRRYLVDEGFMTRANGVYWRTGGTYPIE